MKGILEMCEMKRAHEFRVDEFSTKLRESHDTMQRLTSQIQELQESVNCMSGPDKFQETESHYSGKNSHVFSQCTVIPSTRSLLSRDRRHLIHGICLNHRGSFSAIHALCWVHHRYLVKEFFTPRPCKRSTASSRMRTLAENEPHTQITPCIPV